MIQGPLQEYTIDTRRIGSSLASVGQWLNIPSTGAIVAYGSDDPNASAIGVYQGGGSNAGSIGQITAIVTDSNDGQWYQVDTTQGAVTAMQSFPSTATSNTVFIPTFGDTTQANILNLSVAQQAQSIATSNVSNSSTNPANPGATNTPGSANGGTGGLNWLQGKGIGNFTMGESLGLGLIILALAVITVNELTD